MDAKLEEAKAAFDAARAEAKANPTPENRQAVKDAWALYDSFGPRMKVAGYASRAGKRQAAERRARYGR